MSLNHLLDVTARHAHGAHRTYYAREKAGDGVAWRCVQYDSFWASEILQNHYFNVFNSPSDVSGGSEGNGWVTVCRQS